MEFNLNEYHRNVTDEELLSDIKRVADSLNTGTLTRADYNTLGKYGVTTITRHFGTWTNALKICGLTLTVYQKAAAQIQRHNPSISNDALLTDIRYVAKTLEKSTISSSEYNTYGQYSKNTCFKRFPSWNHVLMAAGLEPYEKVPGKEISNEDLLKEIGRIWEALGRQPTITDIKNGCSQYAPNTFARHFGGWRTALEAFVAWVNGDTDEQAEISDSSAEILSPMANAPLNREKFTHKTRREIGDRLRYKVLVRDNLTCCLCGASRLTDSSVQLHVDHIKPWSKGGETEINNLRTLCSKCNLGKGDLLIEGQD